MDRRDFFTLKAKRNHLSESGFRTLTGLDPYPGPWTAQEVQHLLKRTLFGSTKADIEYFRTKSPANAISELLLPTPLPSPPVNDYNSGTVTDPAVPAGTTWVNSPTNDGTLNSLRRASFKKWWMGLMIGQEKSILEKMTLFWSNHFGTETTTISNAHYVYHHHALLRQHALGNFKALVKAVTIDAGMLRYLNGYLNTASAPDENYARELQELFTLGKGSTVQYTEGDVRAAARVLTGWRINGTTYTAFFDPARHDTGSKSFSPYYNSKVISGKGGAAGATETDELIDMIFAKEEVSKFICRKLYRWFVYYKIDQATEQQVIEPLALLFRNSNYEIRPVLQSLFQSEHFFDPLNRGCLIKSPVDYVVSCLREFRVDFPADYSNAYGMWNYIRNWTASMIQDIGDPPDVSGWAAYYQAPQFHEIWINSDTLPKRNRFTDTMITSGYTRNGKKIVIDAVGFAKTLNNPSSPDALLDEVLGIIYRVPLSAASKQTIKQQILLSNQTADYYWTDAWNVYISNPTTANYNIVATRLKALFQYLMNLPEYQLS
jgi:uncharacterized protein (DUF1800 family)